MEASARSRRRVRPFGAVVLGALVMGGLTLALAALIIATARARGGDSLALAALLAWAPMTWLGTLSHLVPLRLPHRWHALRSFERDGRCYERVGIRLVKRLLRRGPLSWWNPGLRMPAQRTPQSLARLGQRMCRAEASHVLAFALTLVATVHAAARGWWPAAGTMLLLDLLINGWPIFLQRYNRALLQQRTGEPGDTGDTGEPREAGGTATP